MTSSLWRSVRERLLMFPSESGWRSTMEVRDITFTSGPWGHSLAFIGKSSVLSKATSCHPGPAGGRFSKHTCSIPQDLCLALAHPQCPSQDQVRSRRCHTDMLGGAGESRHLALVERWRCASVLRYGYDRARIHGFATVCDCGWGLMTSRPFKNG